MYGALVLHMMNGTPFHQSISVTKYFHFHDIWFINNTYVHCLVSVLHTCTACAQFSPCQFSQQISQFQ